MADADTVPKPPMTSWLLQVQYKPGEPWHDHTGGLFWLDSAREFLGERQAAYPELCYRLVRVTTTYTVE